MAAANAAFGPLVQFLPAPSRWNTSFSAISAIVAGLAVVLMSAFFLRSTRSDKIHDLGGMPMRSAWNFFKNRYEFIQFHFKKSGGMMFCFRVLQASSKFLCLSRLLTTSHDSIE
jgi:hypothetical protein